LFSSLSSLKERKKERKRQPDRQGSEKEAAAANDDDGEEEEDGKSEMTARAHTSQHRGSQETDKGGRYRESQNTLTPNR